MFSLAVNSSQRGAKRTKADQINRIEHTSRREKKAFIFYSLVNRNIRAYLRISNVSNKLHALSCYFTLDYSK